MPDAFSERWRPPRRPGAMTAPAALHKSRNTNPHSSGAAHSATDRAEWSFVKDEASGPAVLSQITRNPHAKRGPNTATATWGRCPVRMIAPGRTDAFGACSRNGRSWRTRRLRPKTAFSRFAPVQRPDLEGHVWTAPRRQGFG